MNKTSRNRVVEALSNLSEASKEVQAALQGGEALIKDCNGTLQNKPDANSGEDVGNRYGLHIREYGVSKNTAALLSCMESLYTLYSNIYEALSLVYDNKQIDRGIVGKELFEALQKADSELSSLVSNSIREALSTHGVSAI